MAHLVYFNVCDLNIYGRELFVNCCQFLNLIATNVLAGNILGENFLVGIFGPESHLLDKITLKSAVF